jgi:hypothetical protein
MSNETARQKYTDLLKDPRWQKKRLEIFQRDGFACRDCGKSDRQLQVHHSNYCRNSKPWDYPSESLRTLCEKCHKEITQRMERLKALLGGMTAIGLDFVIGYCLALEDGEATSARIDSGTQADSMAHSYGLRSQEFSELIGEDGFVDYESVRSLSREKYELRKGIGRAETNS